MRVDGGQGRRASQQPAVAFADLNAFDREQRLIHQRLEFGQRTLRLRG